jgi:hypothetical protein
MNANSTSDSTESVENSAPTEELRSGDGHRETSIHNQVDPQMFGTATNNTENSHLAMTHLYVIFLSVR